MIATIIGTIIFGAIIGALARLVLPGRQNISIVATIVLGIIGALIGYFLWGLISGNGFRMGSTTGGIDWIRWIISIIVAAILVSIYAGASGRKSVR
ncbi:MAG: GlsB/YeaQ/YmgE family stress response membrane protein [Actinomycetes bacterium]